MKPRFVNQKLGKRMSRKAEVQKAKALAARSFPPRRPAQLPPAAPSPDKTR